MERTGRPIIYSPKRDIRPDEGPQPFSSAEEAWFWFMAAWRARADGARIVAGQGTTERPCEPIDILRAVDALRRSRVLVTDHLLVLRHYGDRHMAPDAKRVKERRAAALWIAALDALEEVLVRKGIVVRKNWWAVHDTGATVVQHGR